MGERDAILVIGAGPAGATAARLLAQWGHAVRLVTRPPREGRRAAGLAESLTPSCGKFFDLLGIRPEIDAAGFVRATGNTVWWQPGEARVEMFADGGRGWQVTSTALEQVMLAAAGAAGVVAERGRIDIVVNNAGISWGAPPESMPLEKWNAVLTTNVTGPFLLSRAVLPHMARRGGGRIINVASVAGLQGAPMMSHYAAAKAAVISLTQSLALETAWAGIRVNALVPGWIETDLTDFLRASDEAEKGALARVPMARWGTSDEIAQPALFLASDASSFMTGQSLVVDGGLSAMP